MNPEQREDISQDRRSVTMEVWGKDCGDLEMNALDLARRFFGPAARLTVDPYSSRYWSAEDAFHAVVTIRKVSDD